MFRCGSIQSSNTSITKFSSETFGSQKSVIDHGGWWFVVRPSINTITKENINEYNFSYESIEMSHASDNFSIRFFMCPPRDIEVASQKQIFYAKTRSPLIPSGRAVFLGFFRAMDPWFQKIVTISQRNICD